MDNKRDIEQNCGLELARPYVNRQIYGETFDPSLHEAVSSVQDPEKNAQEIVQEYRKGYKIGSRVIRHSMVVVAN